MVLDNDVVSEGQVDLGNQGYSYKEIVLRAFQKASDSLSVELRGGYYTPSGYDSDTREIACNHIRVLSWLLISKFDKDAVKDYEVFKKKLDELKKDFISSTSCKEGVVLGSDYYSSDRDKFLLEEYKVKKLEVYVWFFERLSLLLGRKRWLEMGGGTF